MNWYGITKIYFHRKLRLFMKFLYYENLELYGIALNYSLIVYFFPVILTRPLTNTYIC